LPTDANPLRQKDFRSVTGWSLLTFLVFTLVAGFIAILLVKDLVSSTRGQLLAMGVLYAVGFLAIVIAVAPLGRDAVPALALRGASWRIVLLGVVGTILLSVAVSQIGPELQGMKDAERIIRGPNAVGVSVLILGVLAPVVEELTFRGMLYGWLEGRWSWRPAFWVSSLAFAVAHYQWGAEGWAQLAYAMAVLPLALLFGWLRRRTNSLLPSVVAHMANNSFAVVAALYGM
jgi:membrane protease YdiL (CAAX protease family)